MTRDEFLDRPRLPDRREAPAPAPVLPALVRGEAHPGKPARVRRLVLPARRRLSDVRLGRPLAAARRGAAAGAAREPDRRGAGRGKPSGALAPLRGGARRRRSGPRVLAADPRGRRRDRGVPPRHARRLGRRGPRGALRLRVADSRKSRRPSGKGSPRSTGSSTRTPRGSSRSHEEADVWHRQVEREALGRVADTPEERERALAAARRCCDALNRALDGVMRENALVC